MAVTMAGLAAAALLVATEFTAVAAVDVGQDIAPVRAEPVPSRTARSCEVINDADPALADRCDLSGFERNGGAFLLLALLTAVMAWGAGLGGSRPAAAALVAVGALVLAWALLVDLPVTGETGALGRNFGGATSAAGPGLTLELAAGALALGAGLLALMGRESR